MTFTEQQVEWIVIEVLRRLEVADLGQRSKSTPKGELRLTERVVTLRSIEGKLTGVTRVVVSPRAVITPAARDELKRHTIELIREGKK